MARASHTVHIGGWNPLLCGTGFDEFRRRFDRAMANAKFTDV
jgi:hypothetical protein